MSSRNRTPSEYIYYDLYFYFSGLSLRRTFERLSHLIKRNHFSIWNWIQSYIPRKKFSKRKQIIQYVIDENLIKVGSELNWIWVAIEAEYKQILAISIPKERNMFVAEKFISILIKTHGKNPVSTDGGTWYPQACRFLNVRHHLHSAFEKSIVERMMQYIKDRTECFDDYFPCKKKMCKLSMYKIG